LLCSSALLAIVGYPRTLLCSSALLAIVGYPRLFCFPVRNLPICYRRTLLLSCTQPAYLLSSHSFSFAFLRTPCLLAFLDPFTVTVTVPVPVPAPPAKP